MSNILKTIKAALCCGAKAYATAYERGYQKALKDMEKALKDLKP